MSAAVAGAPVDGVPNMAEVGEGVGTISDMTGPMAGITPNPGMPYVSKYGSSSGSEYGNASSAEGLGRFSIAVKRRDTSQLALHALDRQPQVGEGVFDGDRGGWRLERPGGRSEHRGREGRGVVVVVVVAVVATTTAATGAPEDAMVCDTRLLVLRYRRRMGD